MRIRHAEASQTITGSIDGGGIVESEVQGPCTVVVVEASVGIEAGVVISGGVVETSVVIYRVVETGIAVVVVEG